MDIIKYSNGLKACRDGECQLVSVEFSRDGDEVHLQPVNGNDLADLPGSVRISGEDFSNRPHDYYDSTIEARWALKMCGWRA